MCLNFRELLQILFGMLYNNQYTFHVTFLNIQKFLNSKNRLALRLLDIVVRACTFKN